MKYDKVNLEGLKLTGISIRTNNSNAQSEKDISQLWESFFSEKILQKIEHKLSNDIYCIYTEYQDDYRGDYTTFIGCSVSKFGDILDNLKTIEITADKYYKLTSKGAIPNCVMQTWNHIWEENYERAYRADFDVYGANMDPKDGKVITYLSIK